MLLLYIVNIYCLLAVC